MPSAPENCRRIGKAAIVLLGVAFWPDPVAAEVDAPALYREHCAACHGADRLGGTGPALIPDNLGRLNPTKAVSVVRNGRTQTQMPKFGDLLSAEATGALAEFIFTPLARKPTWTMADISKSRKVTRDSASLPNAPVHTADPLNLFVVVEAGDSHVTILDGDRFEAIARFRSRRALHGGAKFSPDGRFTYLGSRDGWVTKYDLHSLSVVAEVRAGINTRNIAVSGDGRTLMVANYLPRTLTILSADDLRPLKVINVRDRTGKHGSRVSAVYQATPRKSFIVALKDVAELWEISWLDKPPPVYTGVVHSYEIGHAEGLVQEGRFPIRRIILSEPLDDFFFDQSYRNLMGSPRSRGKAVVVNLDVGREIATLPVPGLPHLGSGITFDFKGRRVMATPNLKEGFVSVIDMKTWKLVERLPTLGPGFFLRSHEKTPFAWIDSSFSKARDALQILDKRTLKVVATLRPQPGKTVRHVEFSRDGKFALASIAEMDGALVIFDAATFEEVKRLPMSKPSGKYNVYNKIMRSEGTSH